MGDEPRITYRQCQREDVLAVSDILFHTGYLGEDLSLMGQFNDKVLFGYANTDYYIRYEAHNGFVAVDSANGRVVGYIIGTADTRAYEKAFKRRMYWRIILRSFFYSLWRHPESFRYVLTWALTYKSDYLAPFYAEYPAHLHINVLPDYQRLGIGEILLRLFETRMAVQGVTGIHLGTSNHNSKALPFYKKNGFKILLEKPIPFWRGVDDHASVIFGKKIGCHGDDMPQATITSEKKKPKE
jgi:ribosomal protein S18 acetylase RimI-like enzyme